MTPPADVLGDAHGRAALMLADRRHRETFVGAEGNGTVCSHCRDSWPCDARRALDAANALIEEAERWREHAQLDHDALGRVWQVTAWWAKQATGIEQRPAGKRLVAQIARIRQAILGIGS